MNLKRIALCLSVIVFMTVAGYYAWYEFFRRGDGFHYNVKGVACHEAMDTVSAASWILVDGSTGMVLAERDSRRLMYPASMTKMMTCILAIESGKLEDEVYIDRDASTTMSSYVRLGDRYRMRDLLDEMMLNSDNGSALALARHVAGDTLSFYKLMNDKARDIGMTGTHFNNPHGLPDSLNYSTARDMALLSLYCMRDTVFRNVVSLIERNVPLLDGRHQPSHNSNMLLEKYHGCHGIKTGFIKMAGGCLSSVATRGGFTVYLVVMNCRPVWHRFPDSASLLDFGFNLCRSPYFNFDFVVPYDAKFGF